ncbi:uncharacterized protein [Anabrus simplex]|uniref:uncharacterized protein n=1 Tax=Anabrus simplex TaxID=316456 RepID=UPI0035A36909
MFLLRDLDKVDIPADNPYTNFIKRPMRKAARWRPPQKLQAEDGVGQSVVLNPHLSLSQKAAIITDKITRDFCEWLRGLCGMEKTIMTEEVLTQLFEIGFDMPAARSLCVRIQEMSHVTAAIAKATNLPAAELHSGLRRELWRDINAEKMKPRLVAFGRCLPMIPPLRFRPPAEKLFENWLEVRTVPPEVVTMAEVFEGITDLRSVKNYCKWLETNSTLKPPEYLVQERIMGPRKKRDVVGSIEKESVFIRSLTNL